MRTRSLLAAIAILSTSSPVLAESSPDHPLVTTTDTSRGFGDAVKFAQRRTRRPSASRPQAPPASPPQPQVPNYAAQMRPAGIYLLSGGQLVRIEFNVSGQTRTGGFLGSALTWGIAPTSVRVVLQGEVARIRTSERSPTFYFFLPDAVTAANRSSFEQTTTGPTSPNEFSLIRLRVKRGRREARVMRINIGGAQSGTVDRDRIGFRFENPRPGVYTVTTDAPLEPGEYSFVMIGSGGASQARFFDFSVQ